MHLDTVFTLCGGNVATAFREVADGVECLELCSGEKGRAPSCPTRRDPV